jgi:hypothetical protein
MFLINFLPDFVLLWAINLLLLIGLAGTFSSYIIRFIPPLFPYAKFVKIGGIILLVLGVWFRGGYDVEMEWREKVRELEAKIALAEEQSKTANAQIQTKIVEKTKVIHDLQIVIKEKIVEKQNIIDAECKVAPEAINILNEAAKNPEASK